MCKIFFSVFFDVNFKTICSKTHTQPLNLFTLDTGKIFIKKEREKMLDINVKILDIKVMVIVYCQDKINNPTRLTVKNNQ